MTDDIDEIVRATFDRYALHDMDCEAEPWHGKGPVRCSCSFYEAQEKIHDAIERLKAERDKLEDKVGYLAYVGREDRDRAEAAEKEVERLKAERDTLGREYEKVSELYGSWKQRAEAAEKVLREQDGMEYFGQRFDKALDRAEAAEKERDEWKQAAGVEAGLRREFLARAEAAEKERDELRNQLVYVQRALLLFRTFAINNATQWKMGTSHHHPIWEHVVEALGDMNETEARDGPDWKLVSPYSDEIGKQRDTNAKAAIVPCIWDKDADSYVPAYSFRGASLTSALGAQDGSK